METKTMSACAIEVFLKKSHQFWHGNSSRKIGFVLCGWWKNISYS